jgi:hypothetical protein
MVARSIRAAHSTDGEFTKLPTTPIYRDDPGGVVSIPLEDTSTNAPAEKNVEGATIQGDHEQGSDEKDIIPNGGYGWVNVGCVVVQNSVTWGRCLYYNVSSSITLLAHTNIRCQYNVWCVLGILSAKQSFRRRVDVQIRLGRGIMCRCSPVDRTWS